MHSHRLLLLLVSILFATDFPVSLSDKIFIADGKQWRRTYRFGSSIVFPVKGNVYPLGHFTVSMKIGYPPKDFELDIDTGSELTWVQCDAPCTGCTLPPEKLYKPHSNAVFCGDPLCKALSNVLCKNPKDQCQYEIDYADGGSSLGVMVKDLFPLRLTNGNAINPNLGFGCGYDQDNGDSEPATSSMAGVLGLSRSKVTIVSQLSDLGHVSNIVGHCLDRRGGGFLFFGENPRQAPWMSWTPIFRDDGTYSSGPAEVYFGGKSVGIRGLTLTFDSGSSYTYFNSQVYGAVEKLLKNYLSGQPLREEPKDETLSLCWKGTKAFKSVDDVRNFFKPLAFSFTNSNNVLFQIPPEAYLIISKFGNVCLGILNGAQIGLKNDILIGDISMLDKIVMYDNEHQQIGWAPANCNSPSKNEAW